MATTKINFVFSQKELTRKGVRKKVVEKFRKEKPGPAKDETYNRYEYHVEYTKEGDVILIRPANLKLGFDFRIDVKGMVFRKGTAAPTHIDIFEDLKKKYKKNTTFCDKVIEAMIDVTNMAEPDDILKNFKDKKIGYSVGLLLKLSKWLAIEMDIRYWNGWGRTKYVLWLKLMRFFEFKYDAVETGFKFYDNNGNLLTENKAAELLPKDYLNN